MVDRERCLLAGISAELVPAQALPSSGAPPGASARVLSRSSASGALTAVVEAPAGWRLPGHAGPEADLELFTLSGRVRVGDRLVERYGYLFSPAGQPWTGLEVEERWTALWFQGGAPRPREQAADRDGVPGRTCFRSLLAVPWATASTPGLPPGVLVKVLREDPVSGARSWVTGLMQWGRGLTRWERHPCWEECYVLEGELVNTEVVPAGIETVRYRQGGYFFRPAGICHSGPGSEVQHYALLFFRAPRRLETQWCDEPLPYPGAYESPCLG